MPSKATAVCDLCGTRAARVQRVTRSYGQGRDLLVVEKVPIELGDGTTRVYHREELNFRAPFKWFIEPVLRAWLENDTPQEVLRLKVLLEEGLGTGVRRRYESGTEVTKG